MCKKIRLRFLKKNLISSVTTYVSSEKKRKERQKKFEQSAHREYTLREMKTRFEGLKNV